MKLKFDIADDTQMKALGLAIGKVLVAGDLVLLTGPLGAGKTTMTKGIGVAVGAKGSIQSPTFVLARTHKTETGPKLVHVDAYRLGSAVELDDLDIDFANSIVVVEWARDYTDGLADDVLTVEIERGRDSESRTVLLSGVGRFEGVTIDFGN